MVMYVTNYHDQLAGAVVLQLPAVNSKKCSFKIVFSRSQVDSSSLRNENKYHYSGIQNMYRKGNVEF